MSAPYIILLSCLSLPKIIKFGADLTNSCQKQVGTVFDTPCNYNLLTRCSVT